MDVATTNLDALPNTTTTSREQISGHIDRVTYHSEETGFCVIKIKSNTNHDLITVTGNAVNIAIGEHVEASGVWINNSKYGVQFKAEHLKIIPPSTVTDIEKYLASGIIKGIGPHTACQLVKSFGDKIFDVMDQEPQRLLSISGIGEKRHKIMLDSWKEQKAVRSIMLFLQTHGVGTARSVRIYKTYGDAAIDKVRDNPYRLAQDIYGIGFKTADILAQRLGIAADSMIRARAGVRYALQEISNKGHCTSPFAELVVTAANLLTIPEQIIIAAITAETAANNLVIEDEERGQMVYLTPLYGAEVAVVRNLIRLKTGLPPWGKIDCAKAIPWVEKNTGLIFSNSQKHAVEQALQHKTNIITGGPGVGKTTIVNGILKIVTTKNIRIALCAPTGRAAKRLTETTGIMAKTIHRLLRFDPKSHTFTHNANNHLPIDLLIVDEASMIDIVLMQYLLRAIPDHAALLIVGDVDQLPSVGPGLVLADIIKSQIINTAKLTEVFRQATHSRIIVNAHRINKGDYPTYDNNSTIPSDFYFISCSEPEEIQEKLLHVVTQRIPKKFGFNPITDIQVLTPMNRGGLGTRSLNLVLQEKLNKNSLPQINRFGWVFAPRDKVIQNVNNYDKEVFNGDIGIISTIDTENSCVVVNYDGNSVEYDFSELDEISLAYATSIHKSQGSEYPAVVIPLAMQHYMMLARNLIYTAVTRGKKLVVIVGQPKALAIAINNAKSTNRLTNLAARLSKARFNSNFI